MRIGVGEIFIFGNRFSVPSLRGVADLANRLTRVTPLRCYGRLASLLLFLLLPAQAFSAEESAAAPQAPCGASPYPAFPLLDAPPNIAFWTGGRLGETWTPPACTGWQAGPASLVVALAGRFTSTSDVEAMLGRMGRISLLRDVRYWSVTDKGWNALFVRATSLSGPDPNAARGDFSAAEMQAGHALYFLTVENRSQEEMVSELRVKELGADTIVLETTNLSPLRLFGFTLVPSGDMQTMYFLERAPDGSWQFYSLTRFAGVSLLFSRLVGEASQINRAVAMYRHLAGMPTDRDPPASP